MALVVVQPVAEACPPKFRLAEFVVVKKAPRMRSFLNRSFRATGLVKLVLVVRAESSRIAYSSPLCLRVGGAAQAASAAAEQLPALVSATGARSGEAALQVWLLEFRFVGSVGAVAPAAFARLRLLPHRMAIPEFSFPSSARRAGCPPRYVRQSGSGISSSPNR